MSDSASALERIAGELAAVKECLARIFIDWSVRGPTLEASTAMAAMAQEAAGHARVCSRLAGARSLADCCPPAGLKTVPPTWPELIATVGTAELALGMLLDRLAASDDPAIRRQLAKMAVEERYHRRFFVGWFTELDQDRTPAGELFSSARATGEASALAWLSSLRTTLAQIGLPLAEGQSEGEAPSDHDPTTAIVQGATCVHCGGGEIALVAEFGGSLMTSQLRCRSCRGYFETVRWRDP
jgi:hypothetical protein